MWFPENHKLQAPRFLEDLRVKREPDQPGKRKKRGTMRDVERSSKIGRKTTRGGGERKGQEGCHRFQNDKSKSLIKKGKGPAMSRIS